MEESLPQEIIWRKGKVGFEPPQKEWMQTKRMQEMVVEARKKLVEKKVLRQNILDAPIKPAAANDPDDYDWKYLCAAEMFNK
jgi:asparagine synthase (glutamine-hydrolysing)